MSEEAIDNTKPAHVTLHEVIKATTVHGVPKLATTGSSFGRLFWGFCLLTSTAILISQVVHLIGKLQQHEVVATLYPSDKQSVEPNIVICNKYTMSISKVAYQHDKRKYPVVSTSTERFATINALLSKKYNATLNDVVFCNGQVMRSLNGYQSFRYIRDNVGTWFLEKQLGHELALSIIKCSYNGKVCTANDFIPVTTTQYKFNCFQFSPSKQLQESTKEWKSASELDLVLFSDSEAPKEIDPSGIQRTLGKGCQKDIFMVTTHGYRDNHMSDGFHIFIGDEVEVFAPTDKQTLIIAKPTEYHFVSTSNRPCNAKINTMDVYNPSTELKESFQVDQNGCYSITNQEYILWDCKCYDSFLPLPFKKFKNYNDHQHFCFNDNFLKHVNNSENVNNCVDRSQNRYLTDLNGKKINCVKNCVTTKYDVQSTTGDWLMPPTIIESIAGMITEIYPEVTTFDNYQVSLLKDLLHAIKVSNTSKSDFELRDINYFLHQNFLRVTIKLNDATMSVIKESKSYTLVDFVSDFGGNMGLYLGASVLTVCEYIEAIIQLVKLAIAKHYINKYVNKTKTTRPQTGKINEEVVVIEDL